MKNLESDVFEVEYNDWSEDEEEEDDDGDDSPKDPHVCKLMHDRLLNLRHRVEGYCRQCPILGYNSAK